MITRFIVHLKLTTKISILLLVGFIAVACTPQENTTEAPESESIETSEGTTSRNDNKNSDQMTVRSPAFEEAKALPARFTCTGTEPASPPLAITNVPHSAKSLALIVEDPDAPRGTYIHWLMWNWPANDAAIPAAVAPSKKRDNGAVQGTGSNGQLGYFPPCPPSGTHRYYFKVYALDTLLQLPTTTDRDALEKAMQGHILAQSELMGTYHKP